MEKWTPAFSYTAVDYNHDVVTYENISQTGVFRNNLKGDAVRLKLNNCYNPSAVRITHADFWLRNRVTGKKRGPFNVTLGGEEEIVLPASEAPFSDPAAADVSPEDDFIVKMYFREKTSFWSVCTSYARRSWYADEKKEDYRENDWTFPADRKALSPMLGGDPYGMDFIVCLSEIQVRTHEKVTILGLMGDSVTAMSTYCDSLIDRLYRAYPGLVTVVNGGISGNRINRGYPAVPASVFPGEGHQFGRAGKDRILDDLYQDFTPDILFILEGVNDCSHSLAFHEEPVETAENIYAGLQEMIRKAKEQGSKVYLSTAAPFGGVGMGWREQGEPMRCRLNELIRQGTDADDLIDLDLIMRDPDDPHFMQEGMHLGDGVHPNYFGGEKIAEALFKRWFSENSGFPSE